MARGRPPGRATTNVSKNGDIRSEQTTETLPKTRSRAGKVSGVDIPQSTLTENPDVEMQDSVPLREYILVYNISVMSHVYTYSTTGCQESGISQSS